MKQSISFFVLIISFYSHSQAINTSGDYQVKLGNEEHLIEYSLTLNDDGSFIFHSYSNNQKGIPQTVHTYGKGKWISDKDIVSFYTDKQDMDEKFSLNFTGTKARFISKSPRDKTDREIKTRLKFYKSDIFWVKGMEIFKM